MNNTSSRAELCAFSRALSIGQQRSQICVIHVDSEYVWKFWHYWRIAYQLDGYSDLENVDLLRTIGAKAKHILKAHTVLVIKVRAHCGNIRNELVDRLASHASKSNISLLTQETIFELPNVNISVVEVASEHKQEECKHKCKNKSTCGHKCCKRHLPVYKDTVSVPC